MSEFKIVCDGACDLSEEMLRERGLTAVPLTFKFDGEDRTNGSFDMDSIDFYAKMRSGNVAKTSGANALAFKSAFTPILAEGKDILYLGFSSALSMTYSSARIAASDLRLEYPEQRIITIDSLSASAGIALLLDRLLAFSDLDAANEYAENTKLKICHLFTVDDLYYLKRGGRVSPTTAMVGNMLGIKPMLYVDNHGRLIPGSKVRGRHKAIERLAEDFGRLHEDNEVYISHADCIRDAETLGEILTKKYDAKVRLITNVGPVIGSHSGPGTLALFFIGRERPPSKTGD